MNPLWIIQWSAVFSPLLLVMSHFLGTSIEVIPKRLRYDPQWEKRVESTLRDLFKMLHPDEFSFLMCCLLAVNQKTYPYLCMSDVTLLYSYCLKSRFVSR